MYNTTRQDAAITLNISTRSIDRYIRSWKLRSKKVWKIVYINDEDIKNFKEWWNSKQEVIIPQNKNFPSNDSKEISKNTDVEYIYQDLKNEIKLKDLKIEELSNKLWKAEEALKNSISLIEFKKNQFLLEESKTALNNELESLRKENEKNKKIIKDNKITNYLLIIISFVLFIILIIIWFIKI